MTCRADMMKRGAQCTGCALNDEARYGAPVASEIRAGSLIAIGGESPGKVEQETGKPFQGPSGRYLWRTLRELGVYRSDCSVVNTVACRPPSDDLQLLRVKAKAAGLVDPVVACRGRVLTDLREAWGKGDASRRMLVVTLGATAMDMFDSAPGAWEKHVILSKRGEYWMRDFAGSGWTKEVPYGVKPRLLRVATLHPAFILRTEKYGEAFARDLRVALEIFNGGCQWKKPTAHILQSPAELDAWLLRMAGKRVVCDVETTVAARPEDAWLRMVGFHSEGETMALFLRGVDGAPTVQSCQWREWGAVLARRSGLVQWHGWNAGVFDKLVLERAFCGATFRFRDDMLAHSIVFPGQEHNLEYATLQFTHANRWKEGSGGEKTALEARTDEELIQYNAIDVYNNASIVEPIWSRL